MNSRHGIVCPIGNGASRLERAPVCSILAPSPPSRRAPVSPGSRLCASAWGALPASEGRQRARGRPSPGTPCLAAQDAPGVAMGTGHALREPRWSRGASTRLLGCCGTVPVPSGQWSGRRGRGNRGDRRGLGNVSHRKQWEVGWWGRDVSNRDKHKASRDLWARDVPACGNWWHLGHHR